MDPSKPPRHASDTQWQSQDASEMDWDDHQSYQMAPLKLSLTTNTHFFIQKSNEMLQR